MDGGGTRRGLSGCVGPKKTEEKEEAGGCVWARRDPGGRLGKVAGMDGDGSGYLKGKATPRSAPGHPFFPVALGVLGGGGGTAHPGNGLSPEHLGGLQEAGRGEKVPRMLSTHPARIQDAGAWVQDGRRVLGLGWELDNPAPNGLILPPWRKTTPPAAGSGRQLRRWDSSQFKVAKGNSLHDIEASLLPLRCRAAWLSSLLNSLFKI